MSRLCFFSLLMILTVHVVVLPAAWATECSETAYGGSTIRGDAQYPPGWLDEASSIEISRPDEFVYGVLDGAVLPQQFTYIKAKLRNRMDRQVGTGTLRAAARYRKRIDYMPDLSADPPTKESMEPNFSSSIAAPISIDGLSSDTPQGFTFDFSDNPIPAGITDLYFIVTFKGDIEGFDVEAIALGIKDLNEPMHFAIWNFKDHYAFWGEPRTAESILNNQEDYDRVVDACPDSEQWLNSNRIYTSVDIGFDEDHLDRPTAYVMTYSNLLPGHYGRVVALFDVGRDSSVRLFNQIYTSGGCASPWEFGTPIDPSAPCGPAGVTITGAVVNHQSGEQFISSEVLTSRQYIRSHVINGYSWFCPDLDSILEYYRKLHRFVPPADDQPAVAAAVNFP